MRFSSQRSLAQGRRGYIFTVVMRVALLPEQQALVDKFGLQGYHVSTFHTLGALQAGVRFDADVSNDPNFNAEVRLKTLSAVNLNIALTQEGAVKKGLAELLVLFAKLKQFPGNAEYYVEKEVEGGSPVIGQ